LVFLIFLRLFLGLLVALVVAVFFWCGPRGGSPIPCLSNPHVFFFLELKHRTWVGSCFSLVLPLFFSHTFACFITFAALLLNEIATWVFFFFVVTVVASEPTPLSPFSIECFLFPYAVFDEHLAQTVFPVAFAQPHPSPPKRRGCGGTRALSPVQMPVTGWSPLSSFAWAQNPRFPFLFLVVLYE